MDAQAADSLESKRNLIVVVEGSPDEMCLISDILNANTDCRVLGYQDPEKAYRRIVDDFPAITIVDAHLSSDDGMSLIRKIREDAGLEAMPIIAIVADESEKDGAGGGADAFISRPFDPETLLKMVNNLLKAIKS